jgi:hypothetical protein
MRISFSTFKTKIKPFGYKKIDDLWKKLEQKHYQAGTFLLTLDVTLWHL